MNNIVVVEIKGGIAVKAYTNLGNLDIYVIDRDLEQTNSDVTERNEEILKMTKDLKVLDL